VSSAEPVLLVGRPNAGKSALFTALSGRYAVVSNYPGTTVEVARAPASRNGGTQILVDTPGLHSLVAVSEEEAVTARLLAEERSALVVHVADATSLETHLTLTLELIEAGRSVILAVNMTDEAATFGRTVETGLLSAALGIPVASCSAATGEGLPALARAIATPAAAQPAPARPPVRYPTPVEEAVAALESALPSGLPVTPRATALLLLSRDPEICRRVAALDAAAADLAVRLADETDAALGRPAGLAIAAARHAAAARLAAAAVRHVPGIPLARRNRLGDALLHPLWGGLAAAAVVYLGLYHLVGGLGAGVLVDFLEGELFEGRINPAIERLAASVLPWPPLRDLVAGEYGLVTLGLRYALAVILPMVAVFFLVFAVIEDSGYLPRLAHLLDGALKRLGLSGRAVIPLALGFGCGTMATLVTRTLPTRRERLLTTILLALAIPCSAQLGVIVGLLHAHPKALGAWTLAVAGLLLAVGWAGARLLPGGGALFFMELPPLRIPSPRHVWRKTAARVRWYMREVLPLFLLASVLIWLGQVSGLFTRITAALAVPLTWLGLPEAAAPAFLFGFFRRDYGAAGLYDLAARGELNTAQLTVAAVVLTLFLPCVAQFLIMGRERGWRTASAVLGLATAVALGAGWTLARVLPALGAAAW
jgi:ferrous iron transport protein B